MCLVAILDINVRLEIVSQMFHKPAILDMACWQHSAIDASHASWPSKYTCIHWVTKLKYRLIDAIILVTPLVRKRLNAVHSSVDQMTDQWPSFSCSFGLYRKWTMVEQLAHIVRFPVLVYVPSNLSPRYLPEPRVCHGWPNWDFVWFSLSRFQISIHHKLNFHYNLPPS